MDTKNLSKGMAILITFVVILTAFSGCTEEETLEPTTTAPPTTTPEPNTEPPETTAAPTTTPTPTTTPPTASAPSPPLEIVTNENLRKTAIKDPEKYKGAKVDLMGLVGIETSKEGKYGFYFHPDKEDTFLGLIVYTEGEYTPKNDEIVRVEGTIEGKDWMGDLLILADSVVQINPKDFLTPTIERVNVGETIDHKGYIMTLGYIELAEDETRVKLTIKNDREEKITFYDFDAVVIQGNRQFEIKYSDWSLYIDYP
ncbi:MAG: hypothetical protein U9N35_05260, partial [Euryarchaeota archaeon]|nr:hypothetical protein [Euryarchaeota archaeon]